MVAPKRPFDNHFMLVEWVDSGLPHTVDSEPAPDDGESISLLDMLPRHRQTGPEPAR